MQFFSKKSPEAFIVKKGLNDMFNVVEYYKTSATVIKLIVLKSLQRVVIITRLLIKIVFKN